MSMSAKDFKECVLKSQLPIALVLMDIFEEEVVRDDFPAAFDAEGNLRMKHNINAKKIYQTWCPLHSDQENGDSFAVYTQNKDVTCYNGACSMHKKRLTIIDCVSVFVFKTDVAQLSNRNLAGRTFWKSARWLVKKYGEILGVTLDDITQTESNQDPALRQSRAINTIRRDAVDYYHYLFLNTKKGVEAQQYLWETRGLKYGTKSSIEEIAKRFKLGVAKSEYKNPRLLNYLLRKNHSKEDIIASKVCNEYEDGNVSDAFKAKYTYVTFPTIQYGRYGTIAGRNIDPNCDKRDRHYKLHGDVEMMAELDLEAEEFTIVEGELDKVSVYVLGDENVAETRGTNGLKDAFIENIAEVRRNNPEKLKRAYILYDTDRPGREAAEATGQRLQDIGIEIFIMRLPKVTKQVDGVQTLVSLDPNDLLTEYKEEAVVIYRRCKEEAVSYDAFKLLYQLEKTDLSTKSAARMALKRNRPYVDRIPMDERIFIMEEVLDHLEKTGIARDRLEDLMTLAWLGSPISKKGNPGLAEAMEHSWIMATDDEALYEVWKSKLLLTNAVLVMDAESFSKAVVSSKAIQNVTLDHKINRDLGVYLWDELKDYRLTLFTRPERLEDLDKANLNLCIQSVNRAG